MIRARIACSTLAALGLVVASAPGSAQVFQDAEARQGVADVTKLVDAMTSREQARQTELKAAMDQLAAQLQQVRDSVTGIGTELARLREEVAKIRTLQSQMGTQLAVNRKQAADSDALLVARLAGVEPQAVSLDGIDFTATVQEIRAHADAMALLKAGKYDGATAALGNFMRRFPGSPYEPSVRFWLGNSLFAVKNYNESLGVLRAFVTSSPDHPRAPAAWLAISNCHVEMKNFASARKAIEELIKAYPESDAAAAGKERLALLKP